MTRSFHRWLAAVLCAALGLACARPLVAADLHVAAAADLKFALDDLARQFETNYPGTHVSISYGSSGNFYAQLEQHAPFDLFFSADTGYPQKLVASGLAAQTNLFIYAIGQIVLWVPSRSPVDLNRAGLGALLDPGVRKIAIANPDHAPYGRAAVAALKSLKLYDRVQPKLVFGENIAQTAQFVESGAADAGIIALSLALAPVMESKGRYLEIGADAYPLMEQAGIILNLAKEPGIARNFREFVLGETGRALLKRSGFSLPQK